MTATKEEISLEKALELKEELTKLFSGADEDGNGTLDLVEFESLMSQVLPGIKEHPERLHKLFHKMDTNSNGGIDYHEILDGQSFYAFLNVCVCVLIYFILSCVCMNQSVLNVRVEGVEPQELATPINPFEGEEDTSNPFMDAFESIASDIVDSSAKKERRRSVTAAHIVTDAMGIKTQLLKLFQEGDINGYTFPYRIHFTLPYMLTGMD